MSRHPKLLVAISAVSIAIISIILRGPVAAIGPLLPEIASTLKLDVAQLASLSSAPVLCFGIGAFISPWAVRRFGLNSTMLAVLVLLSFSTALRVLASFEVMLLGTLAVGLSIAVANVLLPTVVRTDFAKHVPLVTGGYTTLLALSASFAASSAVPASRILGSWQLTLALWSLPTLLAALLWIPRFRSHPTLTDPGLSESARPGRGVYRQPLAWSLVGFFGLQSLGFYALLNWLPTILIARGSSAESAGALLGLATLVGVPVGLLVSATLRRFRSIAPWAAAASSMTAIGFGLMQFDATVIVACVFISIGQSSSFPISLSLISTKAHDSIQTTALSAMVQGIGYLLSALGVYALGLIGGIDSLGGWSTALVVLIGLTVIQIGFGLHAGRPNQLRH